MHKHAKNDLKGVTMFRSDLYFTLRYIFKCFDEKPCEDAILFTTCNTKQLKVPPSLVIIFQYLQFTRKKNTF